MFPTPNMIMSGGSSSDTTPPTTPGSFLINFVTTDSYTLTAGVSTDTESSPVQYRFYKDNVAQGSWQSSNTYTETGQSAGSSASWKCKARDSATVPNESGFNTSFTAGALTLAPVLSFVADDIDALQISYTDPVGRINFVIEYKESSSGIWLLAENAATSTSYSITGLAPDTEYNIRVRATNVNGLLSANSNILTQSTLSDEIIE